MEKNTYAVPLALIFCLFFLWAISSNLLPIMIRQLMKTCGLNTFEASFTETAYQLAYLILPIPIAILVKRYSYKAGVIFGLVLTTIGGLLSFPAAILKEYWVYLCIFLVIATGMYFLETATNPYVTVLGTPEAALHRLNLTQSFNRLGAFIVAMFLNKLALNGTHYTREALPVDYPGGWQAYIQLETDTVKLPYLILAILLIAIAVIFIFSKLPKVGDGGETASSDRMTSSGKTKEGGQKEKLIDFDVLKHSHLRWEVIAQFFYNGGQTAINSLLLVYCYTYAGLPEDTVTTFFRLCILALLLGRWVGTGLIVKFRPQDILLVYVLMNILLYGAVMIQEGMIGLYAMLAISFFMSIMYPTQFSLVLKELGNQTKSGPAFLVIAIVGSAYLPQLTAYFMHANEHVYYMAYCVPMICFVFCAYHDWKGYKVID